MNILCEDTSMFDVGINGFGTIGRRIATAAQRQKDIWVKGVASTSPSWKTQHAAMNLPFFVSLKNYGENDSENFKKSTDSFLNYGIKPKGTIFDLLDDVDLIVDATPKRVGEMNKERVYSKKNHLHVIFQGGENGEVARITFNAHINYEDAIGEQFIRIPSCNTTAMLRYLKSLKDIAKVDNVFVNLIKRGADPADPGQGPINDYVPSEIPSHHTEDAVAVDPSWKGKLITHSVKVPVTLMHMHNVIATGDFPSRDKILESFYDNPRMIVVGGHNGIPTAAEIFDANKREDLHQIIILEKTLHLHNNILIFSAYCHQEADVIPENIDAIRASLGFDGPLESLTRTNKYLELEKTKKTLESIFPVY